MRRLVLILLFVLGGVLNLHAQTEYSIVGRWKSVDHQGKSKAIVEIKESNGVYTGRIISVLDPADKDKKCSGCPGGDAVRNYEGLTIIRGLTKKERNTYSGGTILDPETGKEYSCSIKLTGYSKLDVTGTESILFLGKTTTWSKES